ncbi:hypothetical protein HK099_005495 [Clydaea vesicula]|uniref:Uncharacterized protein n=1 Tax=Clydaea vesicula TaxID=447962 RepID=A0AAD5Y133_9FUNG|nr:hypothetical protein HK099_005495 [Clydaea vesicula]
MKFFVLCLIIKLICSQCPIINWSESENVDLFEKYSTKWISQNLPSSTIAYSSYYATLKTPAQNIVFYFCNTKQPDINDVANPTYVEIGNLNSLAVTDMQALGFLERLDINLYSKLKVVSPISKVFIPCLQKLVEDKSIKETAETSDTIDLLLGSKNSLSLPEIKSIQFKENLLAFNTPLSRSEIGFLIISTLFPQVKGLETFSNISKQYNCIALAGKSVENGGMNKEPLKNVVWSEMVNGTWTSPDFEYNKVLMKDIGMNLVTLESGISNSSFSELLYKTDVIVDVTNQISGIAEFLKIALDNPDTKNKPAVTVMTGFTLKLDKLLNTEGGGSAYENTGYSRPDFMLIDFQKEIFPNWNPNYLHSIYVRNLSPGDTPIHRTSADCSQSLPTLTCPAIVVPKGLNDDSTSGNKNSETLKGGIGFATIAGIIIAILIVAGIVAGYLFRRRSNAATKNIPIENGGQGKFVKMDGGNEEIPLKTIRK